MRVFYGSGGLVNTVTGGLVGGLLSGLIGGPETPDAPEPDTRDVAAEDEQAAVRARSETRAALRRRRGRTSTLAAGSAGGTPSAQLQVRRSTLGGG